MRSTVAFGSRQPPVQNALALRKDGTSEGVTGGNSGPNTSNWSSCMESTRTRLATALSILVAGINFIL
jgi:hypothetical protein